MVAGFLFSARCALPREEVDDGFLWFGYELHTPPLMTRSDQANSEGAVLLLAV